MPKPTLCLGGPNDGQYCAMDAVGFPILEPDPELVGAMIKKAYMRQRLVLCGLPCVIYVHQDMPLHVALERLQTIAMVTFIEQYNSQPNVGG